MDELQNVTSCISIYSINSKGLFKGDNPLNYSIPILLLQSFLASFTAIVTSVILKPLGIPVMVSQILAGALLGPTFLGQINDNVLKIFPTRSFQVLHLYAFVGLIFQLFVIGVQMDPMMVLKTGRKALIIGISVVVFPLIFAITCAYIISRTIAVNYDVSKSLVKVGAIESLSSFSVIACYLIQLNILHTEFSRIAFSSSMISGFISAFLAGAFIVYEDSGHNGEVLALILFMYLLLLVVVVCLLGPLIRWIIKMVPNGQPIKEGYLSFVLIGVLLLTLLCKYVNLRVVFAPIVVGLMIPSGPPLGSALVERLNFLNTWMIMPIFYTEHATFMTNLFGVEPMTAFFIQLVIVIGWTGKFIGAFLPALFYNMSYKDAVLLGLTMNAQGFIEITMFKAMYIYQFITLDCYKVMVISMVVVTGVTAPLIRYMHRSSMKYKIHNRRTIQHSEPNAELRVLACIYEEENVPAIIHLLKATNPSKESPIKVSVVHFVELVGRATPLLISHKFQRKASFATAVSQRIIKVFKHYEDNNKGRVTVLPYTVVSPYASMDNDACMLAFQKRTSLIILPFHKQLATGTFESGIKMVNCNILDKAPCSVGVLIDRGLLGGINYVFKNWLSYHVAVIFLGGADDREALAYGERMSEHPTIELTVFRFLTSLNKASETMERIFDDEMVSDFRERTAYSRHVTYIEEEVEEGVEVIKVIASMKDSYELILMGRRHDAKSQIILDLTDWNKCSELGTMGDIFTTSDYGGNATLLVIQQQTNFSRVSKKLSNDCEYR
ncbi:hypothetical protein AQUCO_01100073v1 [Aquilegia coerulea]|uniref:Uncharacterized protein n=1 Tax=Aquilegia coerulea TaxID=218851 RepID=A0A2G5E642_AQUCA|nr:hypothetical protein AQUCO_01100073v1 [Aquilegia coerulea]